MSSQIRHEWYQNEEFVTISIFIKNVPNDAAISITPESISVSYPLAEGSQFSIELGPFAAPVDPSRSRSSIMRTKIEIKLAKSSAAKWPALEKSDVEVIADQPTAAHFAAPGSQSSSASLPSAYSNSTVKNWDALASELSKEEGTDEIEDGDPASQFFKKLYADSDEDTRRAMMKSYVESNGTALSTNWTDVGSREVKTEPPSGLVEKKW
ncbi:SGS domain-containing protein [Lipomyces oligophaga]|uniref:SGS domain-containing protein n=1 Tax=Lipomyces oligophaga TaxID=45792 RepID=UPI0034D01118